MQSMTGRVALVTGGASGLGLAIARRLAQDGAKVVLGDIAGDRAMLAASMLDPSGEHIVPVHLDVTHEDHISRAIELCQNSFGALDVLVNNAGTDVTASLEDVSIDAWTRVLNTNLRGPFMLCKLALPALQKSGEGRGGQIVNIASTAAVRAWHNASAYHASKTGLLGMSRALHAELRASGIRVTSVLAGGMRTPFLLDRFPGIDTSKLQDPENVAEAVAFVLSMPRESVVAEIMVLPKDETSWP